MSDQIISLLQSIAATAVAIQHDENAVKRLADTTVSAGSIPAPGASTPREPLVIRYLW